MKPDKAQISAALERFQAITKRHKKAASALDQARRDAEKLSEKIASLGEPSYRNQKALSELSMAREQLRHCENEIRRLEVELAAVYKNDLSPSVSETGNLCATILQSAFRRRVETIAASVRPYCQSEEDAVQLAHNTAACFSASQQINRLTGLRHLTDPNMQARVVRELEAILTEALKPKPLLQQFLPFNAGQVTQKPQPVETEISTAVPSAGSSNSGKL
jgi:DNA repair exonuclease SbcCD ATPase subunit